MSEPSKRQMGCGCAFAVVFAAFCLIVVLIYCFWFFRWLAPPLAEENFENGEAGWLVVGDAQGESNTPTYETEGGNPGAHMSAVDDAVGGVWYWEAPESFLRSVTGKLPLSRVPRATLRFDLKQSAVDKPFESKDVILATGDLEVYYQHEEPPGTEWTSYSVPLRSSAGWINSATDEPATAEEMSNVLRYLERLWIRGEFRTGDDVGGIDNISVR